MNDALRGTIDSAFDALVVPSFSKIGYHLNRGGWDDTSLAGALNDRVVMITGANSGLGLAAAKRCGALGADVRMIVRNRARGEAALEEAASEVPEGRFSLEVTDMGDLEDVARLARRWLNDEGRLDVMISNAGALLNKRTTSPQGHEMTFAVHVLGPSLLIDRLSPLLERSAPSRIVIVTSGGMYAERIRIDDLMFESRAYRGPTAYAHAKRAQVILTRLWADRLADKGISVNSMHPGWSDTPGVQRSLPLFRRLMGPVLRSPEEGADTIVWLAAAPEAAGETGGLWLDRRRRPVHRLNRTKETAAERRALWDRVMQLIDNRHGPRISPGAVS